MAYSQDVEKAARRHLRAALVLYEQVGPGDQPGCNAVAGYLFGIAGELAVNQLMRNCGINPLPERQRRDDPFYAHFPVLKTMLATVPGRRAGELRQLSEDPRLFQNWDTTMRYAPTTEINAALVSAWKGSAEELLNRMDAL
jgi:hypothetical protein